MALDNFEVGVVYEVSASLASYLLATGCAEAVLEDELEPAVQEERQFRGNVKRWRAIAADVNRPHRRRGFP